MRVKEWNFVGRADMQHMKSVVMADGQVDGASGGDDRCCMIANLGVIVNPKGTPQTGLIRTHCLFIFAVSADRYRCLCKNSLEGFLIIHQEVAGARTDEDLDPGHTGQIGRAHV